MKTITGYFRLEQLSDEAKAANNIRSKARLDCVQYAGDYKGLTNFVNSKGQLFFYLTPARDIVSTDSKRMADWSLTNNSQNLSSIYIEDLDNPSIGYGYCNANRLLSNGQPNPMLSFRNDGYLFLVNPDYTVIELLVIPDGRNLISLHYQKFIDGGYDGEVRELREQVRPFYNYAAYSNLFLLTK
jgi:hypothetical protein